MSDKLFDIFIVTFKINLLEIYKIKENLDLKKCYNS